MKPSGQPAAHSFEVERSHLPLFSFSVKEMNMREFTLYDLFVRNARNNHDSTALISEIAGHENLSFGQLLSRCDRLAASLHNQGIKSGDRIALLSMNHPGFYILVGALAKIGAILVPLNWRLANDELSYILADCRPIQFFADDTQLGKARELAEPANIPVVKIEQALTASDTTPLPAISLEPDHPACIIYTAAVEGKPRGATLSHNNLLSANLQVITSMGLNSDDVNLAMLPLFHITGMNLALAVMQMGGKNVVMEKFDLERTIAITGREQVTIMGSFPPILARITDAMTETGTSLPSLKYVVGLDGPDNIKRFEDVSAAKFWILYGQAETSGFVTFSQASDKPGTAGKQGLLSNFMLVDENDVPVKQGETGEIVVRGPLVFNGYWKQPEANDFTFRNGWHHTGDLGALDEGGYLLYKGRKPEKELIKPGGENVYPAEVEAVILQHQEVEAVSVIGVPDSRFGEGVKAVCVTTHGSTLDAKSLIEFVGARIARYKKPGYVQFVESLPTLGEDGPIDRNKVKELYG